MRRPNPCLLLVEGREDQRVIPQFMEKFIRGASTMNRKNGRPRLWPLTVWILCWSTGLLNRELKSPGLKALGVLVDANADPVGRWNRIRARAIAAMPAIPADLPPDGLVMENEEGLRFGVWLMPDCSSKGMLETFLAAFYRRPSDGALAVRARTTARRRRKSIRPLSVRHTWTRPSSTHG